MAEKQSERAFIVVPFERNGTIIGARQVLMFEAAAQAKLVAGQLAQRVAGVAILERETDPETGCDRDTLLGGFGAVPPAFPDGGGWTLRLH